MCPLFSFRIVETRAAAAAPAVTLDASLSFDPDVSDGPGISGSGSALSPLSYLWVCAPASECPALFSSGAATSQSGSPVLSMPASLFVSGAIETVPLPPVLFETLCKSTTHCLESSNSIFSVSLCLFTPV